MDTLHSGGTLKYAGTLHPSSTGVSSTCAQLHIEKDAFIKNSCLANLQKCSIYLDLAIPLCSIEDRCSSASAWRSSCVLQEVEQLLIAGQYCCGLVARLLPLALACTAAPALPDALATAAGAGWSAARAAA